ncbi:hypothetical protein LBMAG56_32000 [Verrucomicrobiota bacterium]|nr:hypothetical protein LBMAG56_32000 [Verrucomicrobiota bacterium]
MVRVILILALGGLLTGCQTVKRAAVNQLGDALASGGTTFAADDDPEIIRAAAPFSLKLMESLLAESPNHRGLLLATASGFTQYGYAFVQQEADELEEKDLAAASALRDRARRLYLRARGYGLRALEATHPGFEKQLRADPRVAIRVIKEKEVPVLYWTAAAWGAAIALSKQDPALIAEQPLMEALMDRALALDEQFDHGTIHAFFISYEQARQGGEGDAIVRSRRHFARAMALSGGQQAGPLVALAEAVSVTEQNAAEFQSLLERALKINPDAQPETRLVNLVMQRRARWLLGRQRELILTSDSATADSTNPTTPKKP